MLTMNLEQQVEAILFWKGEPVSIKELSKLLGKKDEEIDGAILNLQAHLLNRGIILMRTGSKETKDEEVMLGTSPAASELIEKITKDELKKDLGKAALETLAIILYKGPVKRSEIDYIRGVNSTFILRNLLIRGLIEKKPAPNDSRASLYSASFDLLSHLGVSEIKNLPNFDLVQEELRNFEASKDAEEKALNTEPSEDLGPVEPDETINEEA
ncbi:MAG: SMC-Scp complex subunit ScpB [Candidatus Taylorbacteria bacterium]|nr:SMC-Scp complex subunit ScpB [Candidatus Taylorbacteria bacterium]